MKTETTTKETRLDFFASLYERAKTASDELFSDFDRHMSQYRGSKEIDGSGEEALTVRNITYEIIESEVSSEIPMAKVDAESYSETRGTNARSIELLCASLRDKIPFEEMNDLDERYTYIYGGSVWLAEWDSSGSEVGGMKIHCISPKNFIPQPGIYSISDMEYCFLRFTTTRGEIGRKYGVRDEELSAAECEYSYGESDSYDDTVTVVTCFYRGEDGEVGRYIFSGGLVLSDIPDYYRRKLQKCTVCGQSAYDCRCKKKKLYTANDDTEYVTLSGEETKRIFGKEAKHPETLEIPYYVPRSFPIVIRRNTSVEGSLFGQSDCEYIRPEQQSINKVESRILQKLLRAGITPIIPEDASISLNNSVFGQVIKMKPGESADMYGKVDTTPDISQDILEADRLYDHSKRILGISDAFQGIDTSVDESGYAKQLRISQATGRLESKRKMKNAAYAELYRIIFEHYLAFADEPRTLCYKDALGNLCTEEFDRRAFIEYDRKKSIIFYNDAYIFSADSSGAEYQREALWERNLENLRAGTLGDMSSPATLLRYWQNQERAHYPYARENVEYFKAALEKAGEKQIETKGKADEKQEQLCLQN